MLIRSGAVDVLVVDSVAALVPRAELEGEMGDAQMGMQARLMSQALRKLTAIVAKSKTCLIFINQLREKIGVMFGNPETTTGGRALKFYASMRLDIRRIASLKEGEVVIGSRAKVKVVKNKVAAPFREAEFDILYGEGISKEGDLLDLGVDHKVIEKSGAWYAFDGERMGQGRENARQFLKDNHDIRNEIESRLRKGLGLPMPDLPAAESLAAAKAGEGRRRRPDAGEEEGRLVASRPRAPRAFMGRSRASRSTIRHDRAPTESGDPDLRVGSARRGHPSLPHGAGSLPSFGSSSSTQALRRVSRWPSCAAPRVSGRRFRSRGHHALALATRPDLARHHGRRSASRTVHRRVVILGRADPDLARVGPAASASGAQPRGRGHHGSWLSPGHSGRDRVATPLTVPRVNGMLE